MNIQDPDLTPPLGWGSSWASAGLVALAKVTSTGQNYASLGCFTELGAEIGGWPDDGSPWNGAAHPIAVNTTYIAQDASQCFAVNSEPDAFYGFICPN